MIDIDEMKRNAYVFKDFSLLEPAHRSVWQIYLTNQ